MIKWLRASTDGFINQTNTEVEINVLCLWNAKFKLIELIRMRKSWFLFENNGLLTMSKNTNIFLCVKSRCLDVNQCLFIVYLYEKDGTFQDFCSEIVHRDDDLIACLVAKAQSFHEQYMK